MRLLFELIAMPLWLVFSFRARAARQATLLWSLAAAVEKQVSLAPFLEALADEAGGRWRFKLRKVADLLHAGTSIPEALESTPGILPIDTLVLIRAGAEAGRLGTALRDAAGRMARRSEAGP